MTLSLEHHTELLEDLGSHAAEILQSSWYEATRVFSPQGLEKCAPHRNRGFGERTGLGCLPELALGPGTVAASEFQLVALLGILRRNQHRRRVWPGLFPGQPADDQ